MSEKYDNDKDLEEFRLTRDTSTATTVESSTPGPSRSSTGEFYGKEPSEAQGLSEASQLEAEGLLKAEGLPKAAASAGPDIGDKCFVEFDQLDFRTIPIFVEEIQKFLNIQAEENKKNSSSYKIKDTFIYQDKINRLPQPIREFAEVVLLKFLIYNKYEFNIGGQKDYAPPMSIYGDTITLKNVILTLIYNCLGDEVVDEMREIDNSEWYECIEELGYKTETEQGKGKGGKKRKNKTRKRGGMPPKPETSGQKAKRYIFSTLKFLGIVCTSLYDTLIVISIIVSIYFGCQMLLDSYEALTPMSGSLVEPLKGYLTNTTYVDVLSLDEKALVEQTDTELSEYLGVKDYRYVGKILDVGARAILISLGGLVTTFGGNQEFLHVATLASLGLNDGSQKLDTVIREGSDQIFRVCFYDVKTESGINLARQALRQIHIDQNSRELIIKIIDNKEAEYKAIMPPTPAEAEAGRAAAAAEEEARAEAEAEAARAEAAVVEVTIPATVESVGIWSRTVNSVSGFVGTAKDTVVSSVSGFVGTATDAVSKAKDTVVDSVSGFVDTSKQSLDLAGEALKVALTISERGECMTREFTTVYDTNKLKYQEFMLEMKKESNKLTTQISYSRRLAYAGLAGVAFGLYLLSYLQDRITKQYILDEIKRLKDRQDEEDALAIGPGQAQLMANPWNNPNLPVRRVGTPGRRQAQQRQLQIQENANEEKEEKEEGGGRRTRRRSRQTKKRRRRIKRRQTRKLRRNTKRRRM